MTTNACPQCHAEALHTLATYDEFSVVAAYARDERKSLYDYIHDHPGIEFKEIVACHACEFIHVHPLPTTTTLINFYQNYYASGAYANKRDKKIRRTLNRLTRLKRYVTSGSFLDVGCNVGFAVEAARMAGFSATGIEIDAAATAYANEHFPHNRYITSAIENFSPEAPFDLVHCTEIIEHVIDTVAFARHLARLTKPGGYLFLTTPDAGHWRRPKRFVDWPEVKPLEHISWQTRKSLTLLLDRQGFDMVHVAFKLKPGLQIVARRRSV